MHKATLVKKKKRIKDFKKKYIYIYIYIQNTFLLVKLCVEYNEKQSSH